MLKAGVLGAGHLGKIHLKLLQQSSAYELVGFFDSNAAAAEAIEKEFGYKPGGIDMACPTKNIFSRLQRK